MEARRLVNRVAHQITSGLYREAQRKYKNRLRSSKKEAWKEFCENTEDHPTATRLHKVLLKNQNTRLNALRLLNGKFTTTEGKTIEQLVLVHFPGCKIHVDSRVLPKFAPPIVTSED